MQTIEKFRKTKIICTIGPATSDINMIRKLAEAGMNIARLNMSHGDHKFHGDIIQKIKKLNKDLKYPIAILLDLDLTWKDKTSFSEYFFKNITN